MGIWGKCNACGRSSGCYVGWCVDCRVLGKHLYTQEDIDAMSAPRAVAGWTPDGWDGAAAFTRAALTNYAAAERMAHGSLSSERLDGRRYQLEQRRRSERVDAAYQ